MKVILLQDVANIGHRFEVKEVPNGHALNMLIPRGMAQPATPENLKKIEARKAKMSADKEAANESFADVVARITGTTVEVDVEANEQGHLFQGLKAENIAEALTKKGYEVSASQVSLAHPIKEVGEHSLSLVEGEQVAEFTLKVNSK